MELPILNMDALLERMIYVLALENRAQLASVMGISQQSIAQSKARQSISLAGLMKCMELAKRPTTLDFLVYGISSSGEIDNNYISIQKLGTNEFLQIPAEFGIGSTKSLRIWTQMPESFVIETAETSISNGLYAILVDKKPVLAQCKKLLTGGYMIGEEKTDKLDGIEILGRVIWRGSTILQLQ